LELKFCDIQNLKKINVEDSEEQQVDEAYLFLQPKKRDDTEPDQTKKKYGRYVYDSA
jgi:hypothetical protein